MQWLTGNIERGFTRHQLKDHPDMECVQKVDFTGHFLLFSSPDLFRFNLGYNKRILWNTHSLVGTWSFGLLMICIVSKISWAEFSLVSRTGPFEFTGRFLLFSSPNFFSFDLGLNTRISWSTHGPVDIVFCLPNEFYCFQDVLSGVFFCVAHRPFRFHRPHSIALQLDFFCFDLGWNKGT